MTKPFAKEYPETRAKQRIIAALDVATAAEAREIVGELHDEVGAFKIGSRLFTAAGPSLVREFTETGVKVFLDLKFHDIPNTVANAAVEASRLGVWMLNVHTLGGSQMMKRAVDDLRTVCEKENIAKPLLIGVTILTSISDAGLNEIGMHDGVEKQVVELARLAADSGLDGVVASSHETAAIRRAVPKPGFLIITPGIRPFSATKDDQERVKTVTQAIHAGSDFLVIGRPILEAADRKAAVRQIIGEVETQ
jgi:orotidine-5'-phosphate decarboxylase